ncbi:MAG TPA: SIS domain-containing protein [Anaerolineales bacterium]
MSQSRKYITELQITLDRLPVETIELVISMLHEARLSNRQIFIMGNGGSASTASHFVCDLGKNTRWRGLPNFRVMGLTDNMALFSALANDEGYENVFAQQLASFIHPGDIVIGISTSGNSANVVNAIKLANQVGAMTIGFTGFDSGQLGPLLDINIHVPSDSIEQVEDIHLMLEHLICKALLEIANQTMPDDLPPHVNYEAVGKRQDGVLYSLNQKLENAKPANANEIFTFQQLIIDLGSGLDLSLDQFSLFQKVLQIALLNMDAVSGCVLLFNEKGEATKAALAYMDKVEVYSVKYLADILNRGLVGWVLKNGEPALVPNTLEDSRWLKRPWERKNGSRCAISVPFVTFGKVMGVLTLVHPQVDRFNQNDLDILASLSGYIAVSALVSNEIDA